jgi:hypothetical protein
VYIQVMCGRLRFPSCLNYSVYVAKEGLVPVPCLRRSRIGQEQTTTNEIQIHSFLRRRFTNVRDAWAESPSDIDIFIERKLDLRSPCGAIAPTCMTLTSVHLSATDNCSYISYRQSYAHHPAKKPKYSSASGNGYSDNVGSGSEERRGLMSAGAFEDDGDAVIEMDLLPPRWADISDEVTEYLTDIAAKSLKLEKLHQKHVLPGFDDEEVKRSEEGEIERLTQDVTKGFHDCQKAIQRVEQVVRDSKDHGGISNGEETMARNIQISLAGRVQEASAGFRKKQSAYLKSKRTRCCPTISNLDRTPRAVGIEPSDSE